MSPLVLKPLCVQHCNAELLYEEREVNGASQKGVQLIYEGLKQKKMLSTPKESAYTL